MIKVLVAEDHLIFAESLIWLLQKEPDIHLIGHAKNGAEALAMVKQQKPDIVLMDLRMPQMGGAEATIKLKEMYPQVKVLFLSMVLGEETLKTLMKCGADGYLVKNIDRKELMRAVDRVMSGGTYYSCDVTKLVRKSCADQAKAEYQPVERRGILLTQKEQQVLKLFGTGLAPLDIAKQIGFSLMIIETYIKNLMQKLSFKEVCDLQMYAQRVM